MKVVVVGTGLIGGSIGLAARERLGATVVGVDPDPAPALAVGAIDEAATLETALDGADAAFVAVPVADLAEAVAATLALAPAGCVVSDVGSVKRALVDAIDDERFVGGHPLAGGEASGAAHARADLFEGATWYLTPSKATAGLRLQQLHSLLGGLGARPAIVDAATHDRVMAAISHLPHVIANVIVEGASEALGGDLGGHGGAGPSFRDATRVAGANPQLWAQIYAANSEALLDRIDATMARLGEIRGRLADGEDLAGWQAEAGRLVVAARREDAELRMVVPNRPGVVAEIALALAGEGINIGDMSLSPSPDMASGALSIWVAADRAERASELLAEHGLTVA
ncbi:MAG TPA: prephenate dehydrogenase/arogenate dehydrogenase family protein [Solirubrobacteraceae bacterium]|nr:prephenate dehydrogenase/arogenate dehydrogenase family protein [Solirubrobacteraceae bacterium]